MRIESSNKTTSSNEGERKAQQITIITATTTTTTAMKKKKNRIKLKQIHNAIKDERDRLLIRTKKHALSSLDKSQCI